MTLTNKINHLIYLSLLLTFLLNPDFRIGVRLSTADFLVMFILMIGMVRLTFIYRKKNRFSKILKSRADTDSISTHVKPNGLIHIKLQNAILKKLIQTIMSFGVVYSILLILMTIVIFYSFCLGNEYQAIFGRFRNLYFYTLPFFAGIFAIQNEKNTDDYIRLTKIFILFAIFVSSFHIFVKPIPILIDPWIKEGQHYHMILMKGLGVISVLVFSEAVFSFILRKSRLFNFVIMIACIFAVVGSQNRTLFVCYTTTLLLILACTPRLVRIWNRMMMTIIIVTLVMTGSLIVLMSSPQWEKYQYRYEKILHELRSKSDSDISQGERRLGRALGGVRHWWDGNPLLGSGWGSHANKYEIYNSEGNYVQTMYGTPHNYFVAILDQTGIIGFCIVMFLFMKIFITIRPKQRLKSDNVSSYSFLIFFLISLLYSSAQTQFYGSVHFISTVYFLFGIAVADSIFLSAKYKESHKKLFIRDFQFGKTQA